MPKWVLECALDVTCGWFWAPLLWCCKVDASLVFGSSPTNRRATASSPMRGWQLDRVPKKSESINVWTPSLTQSSTPTSLASVSSLRAASGGTNVDDRVERAAHTKRKGELFFKTNAETPKDSLRKKKKSDRQGVHQRGLEFSAALDRVEQCAHTHKKSMTHFFPTR